MEGNVVIPIELSRSWAEILSGQAPKQIDLFFIAWQSRETDKFVGWSICMATSEPSPYPNCDARIIASTSVEVPRREGGVEYALRRGIDELDAVILRSNHPEAIKFRNKFAADTAGGAKPKPLVEVVDQAEFAEILRKARGE
jgi:hypothetical protein